MSGKAANGAAQKKNPLREIIQPFIDLIHAPRALWGINLAYVIEGMVYFGMLGYLAIHFSNFVFQGVDGADVWSHNMVMVLTAGITIAMFFLGFVADKKGVRFALIAAFVFMLVGRLLWAGAPNLFGQEPVRPGVFAGDNVSLHVTEIGTQNGLKTITRATVVANDTGVGDAEIDFALDLASGEGIAPSPALESRLVWLSKATVVSGKEHMWEVEYGSQPITARLFAHAAEQLEICIGAVISVDNAYVTYREDKEEWVIRTHWTEDFSRVDTSRCTQEELDKARKAKESADSHEAAQRARQRWPVTEESEAARSAQAVSIGELRTMDDGAVNVVLRDAHVTYVRNGGYFLQSATDGPAIFAFVSPFWSSLQILTVCGMLFVVVGYGMYQPAAYAGVRKFTTPKTAAMGFAMLYALMNLGAWLPTFAFLLRDDDYAGLGIPGTYWVYVGFTLIALLCTFFILSRRTVARAVVTAKEETARIKAAEAAEKEKDTTAAPPTEPGGATPPEDQPVVETFEHPRVKAHMGLLWIGATALFLFKGESPWYFTWQEAMWRWIVAAVIFVSPLLIAAVPRARSWVAKHPLSDAKFAFFIFALIPVQTLFTYNWLVLPQYINRAFAGWLGEYFEIAANANPILIFVAVPIIAAISQKAKVYNMMIYGTFIMAAPAFLLVIGPYWWTLAAYILIMTIGEAMWQPRFLQYAAEIAPEGRTGEYMGVAQLPWFLTKVLVPLLYSGRMMDTFCPAEGPKNTQIMWLIFGCIAVCSTILLVLGRPWIGKDFKTKAD